jgi:hypothetical protein
MLKRTLFITFFLLSTVSILSSSAFAAFTSEEATPAVGWYSYTRLRLRSCKQ